MCHCDSHYVGVWRAGGFLQADGDAALHSVCGGLPGLPAAAGRHDGQLQPLVRRGGCLRDTPQAAQWPCPSIHLRHPQPHPPQTFPSPGLTPSADNIIIISIIIMHYSCQRPAMRTFTIMIFMSFGACPAKRKGASAVKLALKGCQDSTLCWSRQIQAKTQLIVGTVLNSYNASSQPRAKLFKLGGHYMCARPLRIKWFCGCPIPPVPLM